VFPPFLPGSTLPSPSALGEGPGVRDLVGEGLAPPNLPVTWQTLDNRTAVLYYPT
jgi:hypothetical protein